MTPEDFLISFDRLTRFKYTGKKYPRVYDDIIIKHLIEPKINRHKLSMIEPKIIGQITAAIWNGSLKQFIKNTNQDFSLNKLIISEEMDTYNITDEISDFLTCDINFSDTLKLLKKSFPAQQIPLNLKRFIVIQSKKDFCMRSLREQYALKFPIEKVLLCEGITEEILMPKFAKIDGYDFDKNGVHLISAGGKNQVAKLYCELKDELKIPVFILLDADAKETSENIKSVLRQKDRIYLIKHGEFEDIFPLTLIKRTINNCYKNITKCSVCDFKQNLPMTKILTEFFRKKQLGDYQKADFAKQVYKNIKTKSDLSSEIKDIIEAVKKL